MFSTMEHSLSASSSCTSISFCYQLPCGLKAKAKPPTAPCAVCRASPSLVTLLLGHCLQS